MKRLFAVLLLAVAAGCARTPRDIEFPLGVWYEGGVGPARGDLISEDPKIAAKMYDRDFADIAAHGINVVVVPNSPPNHHKVLLDAAARHGLKLIIELGFEGDPLGPMIRGNKPVDDALIQQTFEERVKPFQTHPGLWWIQLLDEPGPDGFERYAHIADALRAYDPSHPPFCCLAGTGAIEQFARQTKSPVVAWDLYPLGVKTPANDAPTMRTFARAVYQASLAAGKGGADPWAVIQCHAITNGLRFPSPAEIRCMTYISLATGNKGVFWFLYQTEWLNKKAGQKMSGLVDENFKGESRWEEVDALARKIKSMQATLKDLKLTDTPPHEAGNCITFVLQHVSGEMYEFTVNLDPNFSQNGLKPGEGKLTKRS